jgi:DNA repair protein RadA/Sms
VGLGGELRPVAQLERRVAEALKLGFSRVVIPAGSDVRRAGGKLAGAGGAVVECATVGEALGVVLGPAARRARGAGGGGGAGRRGGYGGSDEDEP